MSEESRPLSPHLQIYRWQITMTLSILHRASGIVLSVGALFLVYWLVAISHGPESYAQVRSLLGTVVGQIALVGWTAALFYHLCNGIRHLFWDAGVGFEMTTVRRSGWAVVIVSTLLTIATFWLARGTGL